MAGMQLDYYRDDPYWDYAPEELLYDDFEPPYKDTGGFDIMPVALLLVCVVIGIGLFVRSRSGAAATRLANQAGSVTILDQGIISAESQSRQSAPPTTASPPLQLPGQQLAPPTTRANPAEPLTLDATAFVAPYDNYIITQGMHGFSYGHAAIDIAAGKGATIKSSIAGTVTAKYTDGAGNPVLIIENDAYRITLLHGIYTVAVGDTVQLGQPIGEESNIGNVTDMAGNSCRNRDCGYHTHLNVFDKRLGKNVNPEDLLR
ncbi:MAG: M23 family metallopeptidase [Anaerolineae bacterium]|nr:M23 family metallopeptidase [Anaerolineae bacterium]MCO5192907.1 M23 family metallopeptidase [Anaerolineae bacterium]MCO5205238.1 M23 family metallopeptidase [Anaerolineae bacterium]